MYIYIYSTVERICFLKDICAFEALYPKPLGYPKTILFYLHMCFHLLKYGFHELLLKVARHRNLAEEYWTGNEIVED